MLWSQIKKVYNIRCLLTMLSVMIVMIVALKSDIEIFRYKMNIINNPDMWGNFWYPRSFYNSVFGFQNEYIYSETIYLMLIIGVLLSYRDVNLNCLEIRHKYKLTGQKHCFFMGFSLSFFVCIVNMILTALFIPGVSPEVISMEFPIAYYGTPLGEIYYKHPMLYIIAYYISISTIIGLIATLPDVIYYYVKHYWVSNILTSVIILIYVYISYQKTNGFLDFLLPLSIIGKHCCSLVSFVIGIIGLNILHFLLKKRKKDDFEKSGACE